MRDLAHNIKVEQVAAPAVATANITSSAIDISGGNSLAVLFAIGASGDTLSGSIYWTLKLTECDTESGSYTDVNAVDMHGGIGTVVIDAPSEDETVVKLGYKGSKRYVKAVATKTGTHTNGTIIGIVAVKGHLADAPAL